MGCDYLMLRQDPPQWDRGTLVKQFAHSGNSQGAPRGVLQHGADLLDSDAGKPFNELRYERAVFEVLEESCHWYPSAAKHPSSAQAVRVAFDSRACGPVDHELDDITVHRPRRRPNAEVSGLPLAAGPSD